MDRNTKVLLVGALMIALIVGAVTGALAGGGVALGLSRLAGAVAPTIVASQAIPVRSDVSTTNGQAAPTVAPASQPPVPQVGDQPVVAVVKQAAPAVVTVLNIQSQGQASGSGVIIDAQGHIITNNHVVDGEQSLQVIFADGSRRDATLIGTDPLNDTAVIKVDGDIPGFLPLGDSDALQAGETVIAIGSPLGDYRNTVTVGVVSALNRTIDSDSPEGLIQTDAAINSGNSGGPLINLKGEVIGINTLVVRANMSGAPVEGLGFAIPSNTVKVVSTELIATGKVEHPFFGISYVQLDADIAARQNIPTDQGALISQVSPEGPAAQAGVRAGDIFTAINGTVINSSTSIRRMMMQYKPGDTVKVDILRGSRTLSVDVELGVRPNS
jgi:2-alkenal reductase